ncbi:acyltransferase family protein, partial [Paenibacillus sp. GbtcB18]|uniref:acyltransferase family protein n=1 Tax=Paenibacillus sp. GbtcB18 TaxID=2824763 RepID=UPI0034D96700
TESMFYVLSKYVKHTFKIVISLVVFSILGYLDSIYMPFRFPWGMDVALTSTVFFGIGYIVKKNIKPLEINSIFKVSLIIVLVFLLSILELLICKLNGRVDMNLNEYGNYAYFYLGSLLGIFCWIIFSKFLSNINFIKYIGRNSLLILAVHQTCIMFVKVILVFGFKINLSSTLDSFYWALFYTVGTILIAFPIIIIVNKYVPFMVGRKYNLK